MWDPLSLGLAVFLCSLHSVKHLSFLWAPIEMHHTAARVCWLSLPAPFLCGSFCLPAVRGDTQWTLGCGLFWISTHCLMKIMESQSEKNILFFWGGEVCFGLILSGPQKLLLQWSGALCDVGESAWVCQVQGKHLNHCTISGPKVHFIG